MLFTRVTVQPHVQVTEVSKSLGWVWTFSESKSKWCWLDNIQIFSPAVEGRQRHCRHPAGSMWWLSPDPLVPPPSPERNQTDTLYSEPPADADYDWTNKPDTTGWSDVYYLSTQSLLMSVLIHYELITQRLKCIFMLSAANYPLMLPCRKCILATYSQHYS